MKDVKYVLVWGTSARHYPQHCGLQQNLHDEDVVQIVKKKVYLCFKEEIATSATNFKTQCIPCRMRNYVYSTKTLETAPSR